ncbi:hypothetical protein POVWA1_013500 [Plasmodium ovale wallikeri]|uniref:Uncharacterized protein n=1 Tax=Plasmodium ovale wallikeri TaxID=864142 RepID=A0A1A8YMY5_PLAOA|nr:hypothetical protein POVWA1_013500 [Plasmodium ovale wallikeri]
MKCENIHVSKGSVFSLIKRIVGFSQSGKLTTTREGLHPKYAQKYEKTSSNKGEKKKKKKKKNSHYSVITSCDHIEHHSTHSFVRKYMSILFDSSLRKRRPREKEET